MIKVNKNIKFIFSIIFIVISIILSYLGLSNLKIMETSYFNLTRENSSLIDKKNKSEEKINVLRQDFNSKHSKLDVIKKEIEKIDILKNKTEEIENFNKEIDDSLISFENVDFKTPYKLSREKINNFQVLKGNFIDKDLNYEDMSSNLLTMPFIVNSNFDYDLNRAIGKHNIKSFQNLGLVNYLINGDNFMLKSILLNNSSKVTKLKDEKEEILRRENNLFKVCENIYNEDYSKKINSLKDSEDKIIKDEDVNILNALCLDILNSSANYLGNFKITKEDGLDSLKYKDKVLMTEKIEDKKITTNYYKSLDKEVYTLVEEKE